MSSKRQWERKKEGDREEKNKVGVKLFSYVLLCENFLSALESTDT